MERTCREGLQCFQNFFTNRRPSRADLARAQSAFESTLGITVDELSGYIEPMATMISPETISILSASIFFPLFFLAAVAGLLAVVSGYFSPEFVMVVLLSTLIVLYLAHFAARWAFNKILVAYITNRDRAIADRAREVASSMHKIPLAAAAAACAMGNGRPSNDMGGPP